MAGRTSRVGLLLTVALAAAPAMAQSPIVAGLPDAPLPPATLAPANPRLLETTALPFSLDIVTGEGLSAARQWPRGTVESDHTLRAGDIVATRRGLFVFMGRGFDDGSPSFVPLADARVPERERRELDLVDRQVRGENRHLVEMRPAAGPPERRPTLRPIPSILAPAP